MRHLCAVAVGLAACTDPEIVSPENTYVALEDRVEIDCGTYENNASFDDGPPNYLCGDEPNIACINAAIGGTSIAHLKHSFYDHNTGDYREQNFYAGDGKLRWIGFLARGERNPIWVLSECSAAVSMSVDGPGETCWKLSGADCIRRAIGH